MNGSFQRWLPLMATIAAALVGYGILQNQVSNNKEDIQAVERRAEASIMRVEQRLARIEDKLDVLIREGRQ